MCKQYIYLLIVAVAAALPAQADVREEQTVGLEFMGGPFPVFVIEGEIVQGDADKLWHALTGHDLNANHTVRLASPGGNVVEAMRMGRMLRRTSYFVRVTEAGCFSSCALILAGANNRRIDGSIGIHRPHLAEAIPDDAIDEAYKNTVTEVGDYLEEMNIAAGLAELMFSVPPNETRILSKKEVEMYFPTEDPVEEAKRINREADSFDLTPATYRKRLAYAQSHCDKRDWNCRQAILWGVSQQVYDEWDQQCSEWVADERERIGNKDENGVIRGFSCFDAIPPPWLR